MPRTPSEKLTWKSFSDSENWHILTISDSTIDQGSFPVLLSSGIATDAGVVRGDGLVDLGVAG